MPLLVSSPGFVRFNVFQFMIRQRISPPIRIDFFIKYIEIRSVAGARVTKLIKFQIVVLLF